jgi:hypothetical protein
VQAEPHESDVGPLPCGDRADLFDVDLSRDHLMPEPGHDLGEQLEALTPLVRNQNAQVPDLVPSHIAGTNLARSGGRHGTVVKASLRASGEDSARR